MISPDLKKFAKSFIIIVICLIVADWIIGTGLKYLYKRQTSGLLYRTSYSIDSTKADILVFGSSRANHHYVPKVFEEKLNNSFYNCGRDAQGAIYYCAVASAAINRYQPKAVIIDVRLNEFTSSDQGRISVLFPYKDNKAIKPYFSYEGRFESVKLLSHIYPYNSLLTNLLIGMTSYNKKKDVDFEGYLPLKGTKDIKLRDFKETDPVDTGKVKYFKELLARLDQKHIPALVVISPFYGTMPDGPTAKLAAEMCAQYKSIKFLNYSHSDLCKEQKYFNDDDHLNEDGAKIFSNELIEPLKSVMQQ